MSHRIARLSGMQKYTLIWFGQMLSIFGTATTRFALLVWAYQQTGQATPLALLGFFSFILYVLVSPVAGVLIDRFDRRWVMILADLGSGTMTAFMLLLYSTGQLEIWHLYLAEALTGVFDAFQIPASQAAISVLVPKEQYGRVSGMGSFAHSASQVFAPAFAGRILGVVGLQGVLVIDIATFLLGVLPLLFITLPRPEPSAAARPQSDFRRDMSTGFRYIFARPGLVGLMVVYFGVNIAASLTYFAMLSPLVLARTGGDEIALANVQAALGVGGVAGGLLMSIWGGPKRRIHGVLFVCGISFLVGDFMIAVGRTVPVWMLAVFVATIFVPIIVGSKNAIWQSKVEPALQGRVFAVRTLFEMFGYPLGYLIAGPLADQLLEPAMQSGGSLTGIFGSLVGTGPGAGMAIMFLGTSLMGALVCFGGYLIPSVRNIEDDLPDHDTTTTPADIALEPAAT